MSNQQRLQKFIDHLHHGLYTSNGFCGSKAIEFILKNNIASSKEEAVFVATLLLGNKVIITRDYGNDTFEPNASSIYYFNKYYKSTPSNSYWINFIPKFNTDSKREITLQPSIPSISPIMKYAKQYSNKYAPKQTFGVAPIDKYNKQLLDNVHPSNWKTPNPPINGYNLVAIGAGAAGLVSAITASRLGGKSAIIDSHLFGGDCLNTGCVPSKALLKSAKLLYDLKIKNEKNKFGININDNAISINFSQIMERMRKVRAQISKHDAVQRFQKEPYNIDCYLGRARFVDKSCIKVNNRLIYFEKCVICSGAIANVPPIEGINNIDYLTSHSIWNLDILPPKFGIIGCGPIGCEIAQSFALFGSDVTMLDLMPRILNKEDEDAANIVHKSMADCGVTFALNNRITMVQRFNMNGDHSWIKVSTSNGKEYILSHLMVATGRKPNVENMNLKVASVEFDTVNGIKVNDFLETTNGNIYAAGDCCNRFQFTHMVDRMAKIVVANALFYAKKRVSSLIIPWCTYTFPQVAHVGLYETDIKQRNIEYERYISALQNNGRAICDGTDIDGGFVKIFIAKNSDKILGATIVSENAGDQISEITLAMEGNIGLTTINKTIHPYPTVSESIKYVSDGYIAQQNERLKTLFSKILSQRLTKSKL